MTEKNPWLSITEGNVKIAECDVPYFERKDSVEEYAENINLKDDEVELTFDCMPDPFSGSPNSKVYCLNKNPGKPDFCFKDDEAFIEDYDNLYTLKCAQGGYLTKDNIVHIDNNGEERHLSDEEITRYFKK